LNNAVKYSGCTEISILLRVEEKRIRLMVEDNGKGFAPGSVADTGNGLDSMKTRVHDLNGRFNLSSEPGKGTRVAIEVPLPR
jgi:signal transduction histidine kinase